MKHFRLMTLITLGTILMVTNAQGQDQSKQTETVTKMAEQPAAELTHQPTLYMVGYAHLDTQWRWSYPQVIREMLAHTLHDNFRLIEQYPHYIFNFSGANRYRLMKEYYPDEYEQLKRYIAAGRWFPCGSSVEECDVNCISAESLIRQVLYGNQYYRREFGRDSAEFMLPDCFGFPASLPTLLSHCGLRGFSTQKLTWGSANGIPFNVGAWRGLDGTEMLAALNCGSYGTQIGSDLSSDTKWLERIKQNGQSYGLFTDYGYYGTGDEGGSPTEDSVKWLETSLAGTGPLRIISSTAEQMFLDIPTSSISQLPRYQGDLLLTEHSAGSITSAGFMKRCNRKNELLADAAERASVMAEWIGGPAYPHERFRNSWTLVLGGQFHDILPGTSLPQAYEYAHNDQLLALNQFAGILESAVASVAGGLDTRGQGTSVVVYNPLSVDREDVVEATITCSGTAAGGWQVVGPEGRVVPSQVVAIEPGRVKLLFLARVNSVGFAVYDVQPLEKAVNESSPLAASESSLENEFYRVTLNGQGDVAGIYDKKAGREVLSAPMRLAFTTDEPQQWPAWNIDWDDQQQPPRAYVSGPATVRVVESGPVRVAVEVTRQSEGSRFVQTIRLSAGDAGQRVEFTDRIDWQSRKCNLKAVYPLTVTNELATYNWDAGTIQRGTNNPKQYEVPTHQWIDLTDASGEYGVTILTDCKYGSDKPDERTLRLTLLRTPGAQGAYQDQEYLDWGRHEILYGLTAHCGDWRKAGTDWQAWRLNQPLIAFQSTQHEGQLGRSCSLLKLNTERVRVLALKKAEESDEIVVRLVELDVQPVENVQLQLPAEIVAAREVNGQEQLIGPAGVKDGQLSTSLHGYGIRSFAVKLANIPQPLSKPAQSPVELPLDSRVSSRFHQPATDGFDEQKRSLPADMIPDEINYHGVNFQMATNSMGQVDAMTCRGQTIPLPAGAYRTLYLLMAADGQRTADFRINDQTTKLTVQNWTGFIGQWDNRLWKGELPAYAFDWPNEFTGAVIPAYVHSDPVAWYCSHYHTAQGNKEPYAYSYLYAYALNIPKADKHALTLPDDEHIKILAATLSEYDAYETIPAQPLYDTLQRDEPEPPAITPGSGQFKDLTTVVVQRSLFSGNCSLHYTLDGSDPTTDSPVYESPLQLSAPTTIKARFITNDGRAGEMATAHLEIDDCTVPAVGSLKILPWHDELKINFSEPLERQSAEAIEHYQLSAPIQVVSAKLSADQRQVTLRLSEPPGEHEVQLTIRGVRDISPRGNQVVLESLPVVSARVIAESADIKLDGSGGGQELPITAADVLAGGAEWTINLWLNLEQMPGDYTLIGGFGSGKGAPGTQRYLAQFPQGLHFWGSNVDLSGEMTLDLQRWQMLTATYDGRKIRLYKDGTEIAAENATLANAEPTARIGPPAPWSYGHQLTGQVRAFRIWNQTAPAEAVKKLFEQGEGKR
ncbi:MAG: hypothetical protein HJJLKODD_01424 [Phycisphaerae bacterium]|nr:hypothetical protein [Phycisphaerae bacterium]